MPDLRYVLSQHSTERHAQWQVALIERTGEARKIQWLTLAEAVARIGTLKARGYNVALQSMFSAGAEMEKDSA